jgi:hypothetical protein
MVDISVVHGNFDYPTSIAGGTPLHILHRWPMVSPCPPHLHAAKAIGRGFWSHVHDSTAQRQKQNGLEKLRWFERKRHEKRRSFLDLFGTISNQWEFQDPKLEVLSHIFGQSLWGYPFSQGSKIGLIYGRYLQSRILKWPLI